MQRSEGIDELRQNYQVLRNKAVTGQGSEIKRDHIVQEKKLVIKETNHAQQNQHFQNIAQLIAYRQKYDQVLALIKEAKDRGYTKSKFSTEIKKIFQPQSQNLRSQIAGGANRNQQVTWNQEAANPVARSEMPNSGNQGLSTHVAHQPVQESSYVVGDQGLQPSNGKRQQNITYLSRNTRNQRRSTENLSKFFDVQQSKLHVDHSRNKFSEVLQNPPMVQRSFKKKGDRNQHLHDGEIQRLLSQNMRLEGLVQSRTRKHGQFERERHVIGQEKSQAFERIKYLENEIQFLNRDNQRLRTSERSVRNHVPPLFGENPDDAYENAYAPYIINPRENNIRKLSEKNLQGKHGYGFGQGSHRINPVTSHLERGYDFDQKSTHNYDRGANSPTYVSHNNNNNKDSSTYLAHNRNMLPRREDSPIYVAHNDENHMLPVGNSATYVAHSSRIGENSGSHIAHNSQIRGNPSAHIGQNNPSTYVAHNDHADGQMAGNPSTYVARNNHNGSQMAANPSTYVAHNSHNENRNDHRNDNRNDDHMTGNPSIFVNRNNIQPGNSAAYVAHNNHMQAPGNSGTYVAQNSHRHGDSPTYCAHNRSQLRNSPERRDHFDSFAMIESHYYQPQKRGVGVYDPVISTRNKVAFFKDSLVIIRNQDFEVAYKRSELNASMNQMRLVFYVNNKTLYQQQAEIRYVDEGQNYDIMVNEKIKYIEPNSQGRQVIQLCLRRQVSQLNSIIDAYVTVGDKTYQLWVPANFICFDYRYLDDFSRKEIITITPDRQFATYQDASAVLPLANKDTYSYETSAYLYGKSSLQNGSFKLTWKQNRKLQIQGSPKWVDYLGFILCKFR